MFAHVCVCSRAFVKVSERLRMLVYDCTCSCMFVHVCVCVCRFAFVCVCSRLVVYVCVWFSVFALFVCVRL